MAPKYSIGIDLGTTNCVLAYREMEGDGEVRLLKIPQLVDSSTIEYRPSLPSFTYLPTEEESAGDAFELPWEVEKGYVNGHLGRKRGAETPQRSVAASKSWLCHNKVDRRAAILPWGASEDVQKISPVTAATHYLSHLVQAWNYEHPEEPIENQQVTLTVPASFDPVARELTRHAATAAGLPESFVFLEEPQAALYSWLQSQGEDWRKTLKVGQTVLVCDVGGGTTDLTLISVDEEEGELSLRRVAVGEHLLVGGDNMDLAAAHFVSEEFKKSGTELNPWQSVSLWHACREAKEVLLEADGPEKHTVSVLGRGSKLIGGTVSTDVDRKQLGSLLLEGFFPKCQLSDSPQRSSGVGFQEIGLPYESDPAITSHVASFLNVHCKKEDGESQLPQFVLFNGGVFKSNSFRDRVLEISKDWSNTETPMESLSGESDLDYAVARGACHYGWSKEQGGLRIRGGVANSYYVGIETAGLAIPGAPRPLKAICVVPFGMEEGTATDVPSEEIGLVLGRPVQFRFFRSTTRKEDNPGDVLRQWTEDELQETDPVAATLTSESSEETYLPVKFDTKITELGMFELWCGSTKSADRWKLEFNVRQDG